MSEPFSWDLAKREAIKSKIERNITLAKAGLNDDFKLAHPDWVRDAQKKNFTVLITKVREDVKKQQDLALKRQLKLVGK